MRFRSRVSLTRWLALGVALLTVGLLASPIPPSAAAAEVLDEYRDIDGLHFESIDDLLVSEAHNRVIIVGDDRLDFFALDSLQFIASIDRASGVLDPRIHNSSVFFAGTDGAITEFALADGGLLNEWSLGVSELSSIAVDEDHVWYGFGAGRNSSGLGRLDRATGNPELVAFRPECDGPRRWL